MISKRECITGQRLGRGDVLGHDWVPELNLMVIGSTVKHVGLCLRYEFFGFERFRQIIDF